MYWQKLNDNIPLGSSCEITSGISTLVLHTNVLVSDSSHIQLWSKMTINGDKKFL